MVDKKKKYTVNFNHNVIETIEVEAVDTDEARELAQEIYDKIEIDTAWYLTSIETYE